MAWLGVKVKPHLQPPHLHAHSLALSERKMGPFALPHTACVACNVHAQRNTARRSRGNELLTSHSPEEWGGRLPTPHQHQSTPTTSIEQRQHCPPCSKCRTHNTPLISTVHMTSPSHSPIHHCLTNHTHDMPLTRHTTVSTALNHHLPSPAFIKYTVSSHTPHTIHLHSFPHPDSHIIH